MASKTKDGEIEFFNSSIDTEECTIASVVGYNEETNREHKYYRTGFISFLEHASRANKPVNLSSGNGTYKRHRGAEPVEEYDILYYRGATFARKQFIKILSYLYGTLGKYLYDRLKI